MHSPAARERALALVRSGLNDCEVARRTGIPRTTIRDWRRPTYVPRTRPADRPRCPRCWRTGRPMSFADGDYAELLALYLGDGHLARHPRTWILRIFLDSRHRAIVRESRALLERCFRQNAVGVSHRHEGRLTILSVYSSHLSCLFPQHAAGKKHERAIELEPWQREAVEAAPWRFIRGSIWSDGCSYINRTGRYEYLSYEFANRSRDILDLFASCCDMVGVEYRRYARAIRIYRRASVAAMETHVGRKR